jgi:hypothetical protein
MLIDITDHFLLLCQFQFWNRTKRWGPCHKRVPAVVTECVEAAILAAFVRHLRAGFVCSANS